MCIRDRLWPVPSFSGYGLPGQRWPAVPHRPRPGLCQCLRDPCDQGRYSHTPVPTGHYGRLEREYGYTVLDHRGLGGIDKAQVVVCVEQQATVVQANHTPKKMGQAKADLFDRVEYAAFLIIGFIEGKPRVT